VEEYAMTDENKPASAELPHDACEAAAEAIRRAKEELDRAHAFYEHVREQTADRIKQARDTTVGDVVDGTLKTAKRYPGASVVAAAFLGFMLGRWFRR
jgi:hypothetical protein